MPFGAARRTDMVTTGHGCTPQTTIATGSDDVKINGLGAARAGIDDIANHTITAGNGCAEHIGTSRNLRVLLTIGSTNVFVNNYPLVRLNDGVDILPIGKVIMASTNVFVN